MSACLLALSLFVKIYLFPLRKSKYQCYIGTMEETKFSSGVSNAKTVNSDFFTISRVKGGYAGMLIPSASVQILKFSLMRLIQ